MNLMDETLASKRFYPIGFPYPLAPNERVYNLNLLYQAFATVNSFLYKSHVQPLRRESVTTAYEVLRESGLDGAEVHIVDLALERIAKSAEGARKRKEEKQAITEADVWKSLSRYKTNKLQLLADLKYVENLDQDRLDEVIIENSRQSRRATAILLAFFRYFDKTTRPLVCARVSDGKFRVLGRSLVNKREQTGLELKEAKRQSPFGTLIEGGIALVQAIRRDAREEEIHRLEVEKKKLELKQEEEKLHRERVVNQALEIRLAKELNQFTSGTDVQAVDTLSDSFIKRQIEKAYKAERRSAGTLLYQQGMDLDETSIKLIDTKA